MTIIATTPEELRVLINEAVTAAFENQSKKPQTDTMGTEEALEFLRSVGYPISRQHLFALTSKKQIPYKKVGRYLVFSRKTLTAWIDDLANEERTPEAAATAAMAKSANNQR